jgi:two-component system response regulator
MDKPPQQKLRHVLIADDDRNDFLLVQLAFQKAGLPVTLSHVMNGQQVLDFIMGTGQFKDRPEKRLPDLLLLDLKMPLMDGFDVLTYLRTQPRLESLPVVVLSASQIDEDISRALKLGARDFFTKPADFNALVEVVGVLFRRWINGPEGKAATGQPQSQAEHRPNPG